MICSWKLNDIVSDIIVPVIHPENKTDKEKGGMGSRWMSLSYGPEKQSYAETNMKPELTGKYEVFEKSWWVLKERGIVSKIKAKGGLREVCSYESKAVSWDKVFQAEATLCILEGKCEMPLQNKTLATDQKASNIYF